jgi:hypothetical protein
LKKGCSGIEKDAPRVDVMEETSAAAVELTRASVSTGGRPSEGSGTSGGIEVPVTDVTGAAERTWRRDQNLTVVAARVRLGSAPIV